MLEFVPGGGEPFSVDIGRLVIAGWTGRDQEQVARYVEGLVEKGFTRPSSLPCYYAVTPALLTQAETIDVLGDNTSGEAEVLIVAADGELYVGLGSDHTDRAVAPVSVAHAKQLCPKPVAREVWRLADVAGHWDELWLKAEIPDADGSDYVSYQEGALSELLPLTQFLDIAGQSASSGVLFCGTVPVIGGIRPSTEFRMSLEDRRSGRRIAHRYAVNVIPVVN